MQISVLKQRADLQGDKGGRTFASQHGSSVRSSGFSLWSLANPLANTNTLAEDLLELNATN